MHLPKLIEFCTEDHCVSLYIDYTLIFFNEENDQGRLLKCIYHLRNVHFFLTLFFLMLTFREAARECRRKKKEYVKCLENRVAVLENQNKTLIEELKTLKDLYSNKSV